MGILCSTVDKDGDDPPECKAQASRYKMPQAWKVENKSHQDWRSVNGENHFETEAEYDEALEKLQFAEKAMAFDALITDTATDTEKEAAALVKKCKAHDWDHVYGPKFDPTTGQPTGKRTEGEHFLGNVDLINQTMLFNVAKHMPKGAHLHIHFNSCLPPTFLIQCARDIEAMYIRSTLPLTTPENWAECRISFMVLTPAEAICNKPGVAGSKLGDLWDMDYAFPEWMPYKAFQNKFIGNTPAAEDWLVKKMLISEEEAHGTSQTGRGIWEKFNFRTQMMKGLFAYETAFRTYTRACIRDFVADNIQYAEIRPNFMKANSLKSDDGTRSIGNEGIMQIIKEETEKTISELEAESKIFRGLKVIYCTPRSFQKKMIAEALDECIELKKKYPDYICGFDLVGHEEMGHELRNFVPEFLEFRKKCKDQDLDIPFLFHCGETLQVGDKVDNNLFDAILLDAKRVGHGYAVVRHPVIMDLFKSKNIAIEACPISNEILGLTPVIAGHHLPILLANDVHCTINSDNGTFYQSSLSHDFYQVMIGAESMTLHGWRQLCEWSIEHACLTTAEKIDVRATWLAKWNEFCAWIISEYGPQLSNWTSINTRH